MKIRQFFVSNSSSSSFVVINITGGSYHTPLYEGETLFVGKQGETEFGWEPSVYFDWQSKLNFAYLQYLYTKTDGWLEMIETDGWLDMIEAAVKEYTKCSNIEYCLSLDYNSDFWGYIDHQSNSADGQNTEIFDSERNLREFIFNNGSYIETDNDNH